MFEKRECHVRFVDDDAQLRRANVESLELAGFDAQPFAGAEIALEEIDREFAGIFVSDIRMPRVDGLELLARVHAIDPEIPVILITGHADVPMAVGALRDGAFDFLTKPFVADHLIASVGRAIDSRRLVLDNRRLREAALLADETHPLLGDTPVMRRLRDAILEMAQADFDVLIEGETGSGKELAALMLHRCGPRRGRPFVAVNCGALPEPFVEAELFGSVDTRSLPRAGRIMSANRGTLFLDEIDSMPAHVQVRMLRIIEEREVTPVGGDASLQVNLRIVAAAKCDLSESVSAGHFRNDLFYRLNVLRLRIPPLRERRADIPMLFAHFLNNAAEELGRRPPPLSASARQHLTQHDWPGNVRELRNFALRFLLSMTDGVPGLALEPGPPLPRKVEQYEASLIRQAMASAAGDIRTVLGTLGIPRKTLYDKFVKHGIDPEDYRSRR